MKAKKLKSILGLAFEGRSLSICLMQRPGGRLRIDKSLKVPLMLDPLSGEPELVGREIRNHLDGAGIRERNCAVCLPLKWILMLQTEIPADLTGEDLDSYITMQAERSFPYPPEDLSMSVVTMKPGEGQQGEATVAALARSSLANLEAVFKAAKLRPAIFTIAPASLGLSAPTAALIAGEGGLDLAVYSGGGFTAIRPLDDALESEGPDGAEWDIDLIAQQLRITLGRLPQALRAGIKAVQVYGSKDDVASLVSGLRPALTPMGLAAQSALTEIAGQKIDPAQWSPAATVAAATLLGETPVFNLLPPHVGRFKQIAGRISARSAIYLGGGAILLLLGIGGLFYWQSYQLKTLTQLNAAEKPERDKLAAYDEAFETYGGWFAEGTKTLLVLSKMATAFPDAGTVWLKNLEIKDVVQSVDKKVISVVTCSGNARSNADWLALDTKLSTLPEVNKLEIQNVRNIPGQPLQFSFTFRWEDVKPAPDLKSDSGKKADVTKKANAAPAASETKKSDGAKKISETPTTPIAEKKATDVKTVEAKKGASNAS